MGCSSQGAVPIRQPHLVRHRLPVTDKVACKDAYNAKEAYSAVAEPLRSRLAGQCDASGFDVGATQRLRGHDHHRFAQGPRFQGLRSKDCQLLASTPP